MIDAWVALFCSAAQSGSADASAVLCASGAVACLATRMAPKRG